MIQRGYHSIQYLRFDITIVNKLRFFIGTGDLRGSGWRTLFGPALHREVCILVTITAFDKA